MLLLCSSIYYFNNLSSLIVSSSSASQDSHLTLPGFSPHSPFLHLIKSSSIAADHLLLAADKSSSHAIADHQTTLIINCHRSLYHVDHQTTPITNHAMQIIKRRLLWSSNHVDQIIKSLVGFGLGGWSSSHAIDDHQTTLIIHCSHSSNYADHRTTPITNHADQIIKSSVGFVDCVDSGGFCGLCGLCGFCFSGFLLVGFVGCVDSVDFVFLVFCWWVVWILVWYRCGSWVWVGGCVAKKLIFYLNKCV